MCISGATTDNLPPGVMYRVKASYKYQAEDVDELNFEVGEIIDVVEYDDSEDQVWLFEPTFKCIFPLSFDFFVVVAGGRMAHGCYAKHRSKRNVSSQFHSANVKIENLFLVLYNNFY